MPGQVSKKWRVQRLPNPSGQFLCQWRVLAAGRVHDLYSDLGMELPSGKGSVAYGALGKTVPGTLAAQPMVLASLSSSV